MASKIPELTVQAAVHDVDADPGMLVTSTMVDEAVEKVLKGRPLAEAEALIASWASDGTSELGRLLQGSIAARASRLKSYETIARVPVTIPYSLNDEQQKAMMMRHPDMELNFMAVAHHDHALAAAERKVASVRLHSKIPSGARYVDFGGSVLMHVEQGNTSVVVVGGLHDSKDPTRDTLVNMRLKQLAASQTASPAVRHMAASVLQGDGKYFRRGSLEGFSAEFKFGVMSHVYDVPLREIPKMMHRCGMLLFEGVMHYSPRFHLESEGELDSVGARFQVKDGTFHMGFVDSPSLWYAHSWEEFMRYGIDQVYNVDGVRYSYRVHERRGDTISFRIMPSGHCSPDAETRLFNPEIPMVEVRAFDLTDKAGSRATLQDSVRRYPEDVWDRMVRSAMLDALKGELQVNNHVLSYRNITAGHMYNGISTVSRKVEMTDIPYIVIDSGMFALSQVMLFRRGVTGFIDAEMKRRAVLEGSTIELGMQVFFKGLKAAASAPMWPLRWILSSITSDMQTMVGRLVEAAPVPRYVTVRADPVAGLMPGINGGSAVAASNRMFEFAKETEALNAAIDALVDEAEKTKAGMPSDVAYNVNIAGQDFNPDVVESSYAASLRGGAVAPPSWLPVEEPVQGAPDVYKPADYFDSANDRISAVNEAMACAISEARTLEVWCSEKFEAFAPAGRVPAAAEIKEAAERNRDFDFWHVRRGVVMHSVSGNVDADMVAGGVYCPTPIQVLNHDGVLVPTHLVAVNEAEYTEGQVRRTHFVMDADYTGLVLTCRDLIVFNGAQLVAGLKRSLTRKFEFQSGGLLGGPGCGKTTSIVKLFRRGNMVITPLKESAKDVRAALVRSGILTKSAAEQAVRTVDSVLCQAGKSEAAAKRIIQTNRVLVDECFNTLPGRYYAALALLGTGTVVAFGDNRQIEPVVRAEVELMHVYMRYQHCVERFLNFRCTPEVLACFNRHYGGRLRAVKQTRGEVKMIEGVDIQLPTSADLLLLVMNQADKNKLVKMFPRYKDRVKTTHEAQGKEADEVYLFNFETRPIPKENPRYLYCRDAYVNVAISRARNKFVYAYSSTHPDTVKEWLMAGSSPALVKAVADVRTAGSPVIY